jgi:hypothetical protein
MLQLTTFCELGLSTRKPHPAHVQLTGNVAYTEYLIASQWLGNEREMNAVLMSARSVLGFTILEYDIRVLLPLVDIVNEVYEFHKV